MFFFVFIFLLYVFESVSCISNIFKFIFQIAEGLKAVPFTAIEKKDCSLKLSPQELYQINIGNYFLVSESRMFETDLQLFQKLVLQNNSYLYSEHDKIDFGDVCQKSVTVKVLKIANNLNKHIHIMFDVSI